MRAKAILLIIVLALILSGCGYNPPYTPSATPTPLPAGQQRIVTALPAVDTSPNTEEESLPDYVKPDYLIGSQNDVDIYFVDAYLDDSDDECYEIILHNRSDKTLFANCVNISINGRSLLPYISAKADPHSYYLYRDTLPKTHGSFLGEYNEAATIQVEMYFSDYTDNSLYAYIDQKLIIDEDIQISEPTFNGQIIHDENDFIIGIEKVVDGDNITGIVMYYKNNSEQSLVALIEKMQLGSHEISHQTPLSITHNSYAYWSIKLDDPIPNSQYESTIYYAVVNDISASVEGMEGDTLTFTLK